MIDVFFDGKCGLCSKEIMYYRNIAKKGIFKWHDIAEDPTPLNKYNIPQSTALRLLHLRDDNGKWHIGVDAFIVIWLRLENWYYLGFLIGLPGVKQVASLFYMLFARFRFSRLEHCQIALNEETISNREQTY